MSRKATFKASDSWKDYEVTIDVDNSKLTPALAHEINNFWHGSTDRLEAENGDPVAAVVRFAGACLINEMLSVGGADFSESNTEAGNYWTNWLGEQEGWPSATDSGIRCVAATVEVTDFDYLELKKLA